MPYRSRPIRSGPRDAPGLPAVALMVALAGCSSTPIESISAPDWQPPVADRPYRIGEKDVVEVGFFKTLRVQTAPYRIQIGDRLQVRVADRPELSTGEATVLPDGTVSLALVGDVPAGNRTTAELAEDVARRYRARNILDPRVVVTITQADRRLQEFIDSIVRKDTGSNLLFKVFESQRVELPLVGEVQIFGRTIDAVRAEVHGRYQALFGDRLMVTVNVIDRPDNNVYVMGEVYNPGVVRLDRSANTLVALAAAGGLRVRANPKQIIVVRFHDDGSFDHWVVDHDRALRDGAMAGMSIPLEDSDVVYVSKSPIANVGDFVEQYIRRVIPLPASINVVRDTSPY